jgi:hypothetical protein
MLNDKGCLTSAPSDSGYAAAGTVREFEKWRDNTE